MQIISWNVASIRARLPLLMQLLAEKQPDIVFLQEIKATAEVFPFEALRQAGYEAYINGQKGFNGVAVLSKQKLSVLSTTLLAENDLQARFIALQADNTVYVCVYAPNGAPPASDPADTSRLSYKLKWFQALSETVARYLKQGFDVVLGGDFNVIEEDIDVYNPALFQNSPLMVPPVRKAFQEITSLSLINTLKKSIPYRPIYSYWDFQMGAFRRDWGILLDYIFISRSLKDKLAGAGIYKSYRAAQKPSDHAPVFCVLNG